MDWELLSADAAGTAAALRAQLNQMAAASQVLEHSAESEKARSYLAMINQSICRMLRIVGRMELSHRLSGDEALGFAPKHVDLIPWLSELSLRLEGILANIGVTFTLRAPVVLPLRADCELLQQMLLEVVAGMALAGTQISLTVAEADGSAHLTLSDRGPGEAEDRPRLPSLLEEQEEQTSLRLARRIAELHGGSLMVSADAALGLTVVISLPSEKAPLSTLESPRAPWPSAGFDPVLVSMSELLPARAFLPQDLD